MKKNYDERAQMLGGMIAAVRKMKGLTQTQLAQRAGISKSYLNKIETASAPCNFSIALFFSLADALNINPSILLELTLGEETHSLWH